MKIIISDLKNWAIAVLLVFAFTFFGQKSLSQPVNNNFNSTIISSVQQKLNKEPFYFTENVGQVVGENNKPRTDILFSAHSGSMHIFITANAIHYQIVKVNYPIGYQPGKNSQLDLHQQTKYEAKIGTETDHFNISLVGSNLHPVIRKELKKEYRENFYLPQCPDGLIGVSTYERLVMQDVYPGIDWVIYSNGKTIKYDFVVHPFGNPQFIKIQIKDTDSSAINENGDLIIHSRLGDIAERAPVSYSENKKVASKFKKDEKGLYSFSVARYDPDQTLIIDPVVEWGSYYEGQFAGVISTDNVGNVYLSGSTESVNNVAIGGYQNNYTPGPCTCGFPDAYLVKFNSSGSRLWGTYYGGNRSDYGTAIAVDSLGNVFLTGQTFSAAGFASVGAFQTSNSAPPDDSPNAIAGSNAFLVKFNGDGVRQWGTFFGGNVGDFANGCSVDKLGNVYIVGGTISTANLAYGGWQSNFGGFQDIFIAKFDGNGNRRWASYYGGTDFETANGCSNDSLGNVYLVAQTYSYGLGTAGVYQPNLNSSGDPDALLVKFNSAGVRQWSSYFGSNGFEDGNASVVDISGNIYISGTTNSPTGIANGGFQNNYGGIDVNHVHAVSGDAYLAKFNSNGGLIWSTYYGGEADDLGSSCSTDHTGNVYLVGATFSQFGIASDGIQNSIAPGGVPYFNDAFIVKFNSSGNRIWGSYYGGDDYDEAYSCAVDNSNNFYVSGFTISSAGIASGGFQNTFNNTNSTFLVKINDFSIQQSANAAYTLCAGDAISTIAFSTIGNYNSNNIFKLELSNASGNFDPIPPILATASGLGNVVFSNSLIPYGTAQGNYKLRISSTSPSGVFLLNNLLLTVTQGADISSLVITKTNPTTCTSVNGMITFSGLQPNLYYAVTGQKSGAGVLNVGNFNGSFTTSASGVGSISSLGTGKYFNLSFAPNGLCPVVYDGSVTLVASSSSSIPITSNSPVCEGDPFYMNIPTPVSGATIAWDGPGSQASTSQNLTGNSANIGYKGIWKVTVAKNGCSAYGSIDFRVYRQPVISNISIIQPTGCSDGSIIISASPRPDTGYISFAINGVTQPTLVILPNGSGDFVVAGLSPGIYSNIKLGVPGGHCSGTSTSIFTLASPPPTGLGCLSIAPTYVALTWQSLSTISSAWDIYVSTSPTAPGTNTTPTNSSTFNTYTVGNLLPSTHYYVWIRLNCGNGNYSSWSYGIELTTPPENDNALNANAISVGATCSGNAYTNVGATQPYGREPLASCNQTNYGYSTVWFKFIAPASGSVRVSTDIMGGTLKDTRLAIFSATDSSDYSTFNLIACDEDNGSIVPGASVAYAVGLAPGNTYYVQVCGSQLGEEGTFCVIVNDITGDFVNNSISNCDSAKTPVGYNAKYKGPVSIVDNNSKLIAIVQNLNGAAPSEYFAKYSINTAALRSTGSQGNYYLDRNYFLRNSGSDSINLYLFFLSTELARLSTYDISATLANLKISKYTSKVCTPNYYPDTSITQVLTPTLAGTVNDVNWINIKSKLGANFFIHSAPLLFFAYSFNGNGNWSDTTQWLNNLVPPNPLSSGNEILINPIITGSCKLNLTQHITGNGKITIVTGKKLIIPGELKLQ